MLPEWDEWNGESRGERGMVLSDVAGNGWSRRYSFCPEHEGSNADVDEVNAVPIKDVPCCVLS